MQILPNGKCQFIDQNGAPLVNGSVYFYAPGTTNPLTTYQDSAGSIPNENPIALDSRGQAIIWGADTYRQVVYDASGVLVWDQIVSAAASAAALAGTGGAALIGMPDGTNLAQAFTLGLNRVVDSIAALRATNHTFYQRAFVTGYYGPHDGGGGAYQYDPNDTSSADNGGTIIVATDGARWKLQTTGGVSLKQFGAKGNGTSDDAPLILGWLNYLIASGSTGTVPDGTYFMASPLTVNVTGNLDVRASDNAIFKGGSAISQNMILLLATADTNETYHVSWRGGGFDISQTAYVAGALSGSGLCLQWVWRALVEGVKFIGPADYTQGGAFGGDTGLSVISCQFVTVDGCNFSGIRDTGIYATGDSNTANNDNDGRELVVTNCHFNKCAAGVSAKRQFQLGIVDGCTFYYCLAAVELVTTDVVIPDPPAGGRWILSNNSLAYCGRYGFDLRYSNVTGTLIIGNRIQDIGRSLDGVTPISNAAFILLEGSSYNFIQGNWMGFQDWATGGVSAPTPGVLMQAFTYNGTSYLCQYNVCSDNYMIGMDYGFRETPGQAGNNQYQVNTFTNVAQNYNNIQNTSTVFDQQTGTWTVTLYDAATGGNASPTTVTGNYVKTGKTVTVTFTLSAINTTGMTAANPVYVALPFSAPANIGAVGSILLSNVAFPSGATSVSMTLPGGQNRALITASGSGVGNKSVAVSNLTSGTSGIVQASITYQVAQ